MSGLSKKVSYLKGFRDGIGAELESDEGKIINKLLDIVEEMAEEIDRLSNAEKEREKMIDDLENDVLMLANDIYGDDDDDDDFGLFDDDDDDDDFDDFDDSEDDESSDLFELQCPECGEDFMISYDEILDGKELRCPHCEKRIELELDEDESDEDWSF